MAEILPDRINKKSIFDNYSLTNHSNSDKTYYIWGSLEMKPYV